MEASFDRNVNLNVSLQSNLPDVPEGKTAAQAVLKPLLARLANLTVTNGPQDLEALLARLGNENTHAKESSAKQTLRIVYATLLSRVQENAKISAQNQELLKQAEALGGQVEDVQQQITDQTARLAELKKQLSTQTATVTELEIKTAMLEKQVELAKSQQLTPAEKRVAELKKKRLAEQDKQKQAELDQQIEEAEKELLAAQASVVSAQGDLANAQGALATAKGNLVAMKSQAAAASKTVEDLKATKSSLEGQIDNLLDQLIDEEVARALVDILRNEAASVKTASPDELPERNEREEEYLEEHSVARILQDAADRRVQALEDAIAASREERV